MIIKKYSAKLSELDKDCKVTFIYQVAPILFKTIRIGSCYFLNSKNFLFIYFSF